MEKCKVGYILSYYSPNYIRTLVLIESIKLLPNVELYQARNHTKGFLRYFETLAKLIVLRLRYNPEIYILGFRGHEVFFPVRLITLGKKLIYDEFMSPYDSLVNERHSMDPDSFIARIAFLYERAILRISPLLLTDTTEHATYFAKLFNVPLKKFVVIPVGAEMKTVDQAKQYRGEKDSVFSIFTYGTMLPLHGFENVVHAAKLLEKYPIRFIVAGSDKQGKLEALLKEMNLKNIEHHRWIPYEELINYINKVHLCIGGPLGTTGQASRVVTGKTYHMLAAGKPVIIADTPPHELFKDKENCLKVVAGSPQALADAILWGYNNQDELTKIGAAAQQEFLNKYSFGPIAEIVANSLKLLLSDRKV